MIFLNVRDKYAPDSDKFEDGKVREFMYSNVLTYDSSNFFFTIDLHQAMSKLDLVQIKNVVFNPPATIVFWSDNTKTVVKAENETFDPEKGLAMAIAKKALGNKGNYYETFKKWLPKTESKEEPKTESKDYAAEEQSKKNGCHNCAFYSRSIIERPCNNCNPYKHSEWKPMYTLSDAEDDDNVL